MTAETLNATVLEFLQSQGFQLEEQEGFGYDFEYEGTTYVYIHPKNDDSFLTIGIPAVLEYDEESSLSFYKLTDYLNATLKYLKCYKAGGSLWLFYEREVMEDEKLEEVIPLMILHLDRALYMFHKHLREFMPDTDDDADESIDTESGDDADNDNNDSDATDTLDDQP